MYTNKQNFLKLFKNLVTYRTCPGTSIETNMKEATSPKRINPDSEAIRNSDSLNSARRVRHPYQKNAETKVCKLSPKAALTVTARASTTLAAAENLNLPDISNVKLSGNPSNYSNTAHVQNTSDCEISTQNSKIYQQNERSRT